ncbi:YeeE/YedE family protein [Silvimonas iriomotensis]|uniref:Membrane protein n=1 Tax=Silvimonas iriomotensis TaxID=449662 RepID=A0ABQ2P591_9NEIS|nr:YeeE/YedE family protein [Silvimonas iriomotensis]GGP18516.1 membrane protein [Silvimonas iriomotensis]
MTIDWMHFSPWSALAGGALIGLAAGGLFLLNGRIAGISGILGGLFFNKPERANIWRWAFVAGLLLAPVLWRGVAALPAIQISASSLLLVIAGLLVGFGTRLGSGCTSGHGVCGLSRLSARSLVATLTFMAVGFVTVWLLQHGLH